MTTTYSALWRMPLMTTADPAVKNVWGNILTGSMSLPEQGAVGILNVPIGGLTSYTLTTANDAPDQARYRIQVYTGALTGDCTVTVPNLSKVGAAVNLTTGGHNVIITCGGGTTLTIFPSSGLFVYEYQTDGSGNVSLFSGAFSGMAVFGSLAVSGTTNIAALTASGAAAFGSNVTIGGSVAVAGNTNVVGFTASATRSPRDPAP